MKVDKDKPEDKAVSDQLESITIPCRVTCDEVTCDEAPKAQRRSYWIICFKG